jgi:hypothetical protein
VFKKKFKTGEYVRDDEHRDSPIVARLQLWLIDEDYITRVHVHDLISDALHEIERLKAENDRLASAVQAEQSLADALAFTTSGIVALVPEEVLGSLGDFGEKIQVVLDAWSKARGINE